MAPAMDSPSPTYISSRSADMILSDIRPIKLKIEALRCINVLLDEILYSVLNSSRSLATDHLNSGLRRILPTTLGKEALLEAEVELRAYLERTNAAGSGSAKEDDKASFDLQYAFELLRLKCEAYSTLNDSDEDADAERRLHERMARVGNTAAPKPASIAQAALYLTAILEAICEHTLGIVGRVAARDSSRTLATVHDLFVALCEDDNIYGLFKTMKVYAQIETLSKPPQPRRSKSFSRDRTPPGRDSPSHDGRPTNSRSRISSESSKSNRTVLAAAAARAASPAHSRSSMDKNRALKMLMHGRSPSAVDKMPEISRDNSRRSSSISDETRQTWAAYTNDEAQEEDDAEFDDLMRSGSTMKVSLTPDRLRTMEVHEKEGGMRNRKRGGTMPSPASDNETATGSPSFKQRPQPMRRPSKPTVEASIQEDEEDSSPVTQPAMPRTRQTSMHPTAAPNGLPASDPTPPRARSHSAAAAMTPKPTSKTPAPPLPSKLSSPATLQKHRPMPPQLKPVASAEGLPTRTRRIVRNRESLDLDDIMNGSDDDDVSSIPSAAPSKAAPQTPMRKPTVSRDTQDLMDFLSSGPPDADLPVMPQTASAASFDTRKPNRLQRMVSKLTNKASTERLGARYSPSVDDLRTTARMNAPPMRQAYTQPRAPPMASLTNGSRSLNSPSKTSLPSNVHVVTRPPRFPKPQQASETSGAPLSPPSSPSQDSTEDLNSVNASIKSTASGRPQRELSYRKAVPKWEPTHDTPANGNVSRTPSEQAPLNARARATTLPPSAEPPKSDAPVSPMPSPRVLPPRPKENGSAPNGMSRPAPREKAAGEPNGTPQAAAARAPRSSPAPPPDFAPPSTPTEKVQETPRKRRQQLTSEDTLDTPPVTRATPSPSPSIAPAPSPAPVTVAPAPGPSKEDAEELRQLITKATSADECRLLVDMFLMRSGLVAPLPPAAVDAEIPYPSPSPSFSRRHRPAPEPPLEELEHSVVHLLLGEA